MMMSLMMMTIVSDMETCSDEYLEDEELFNRRYKEGYNIYSEPYAK